MVSCQPVSGWQRTYYTLVPGPLEGEIFSFPVVLFLILAIILICHFIMAYQSIDVIDVLLVPS
jgi:hypothetical protein